MVAGSVEVGNVGCGCVGHGSLRHLCSRLLGGGQDSQGGGAGIVPGQGELQGSLEEAQGVAAVVALAQELVGKEFLAVQQP